MPPEPAERYQPSEPPLVGIRGWLLLLALGQIVTPLRQLAEAGLYFTDSGVALLFEQTPKVIYGEFLLISAQILITLYTSYLFFTRRRKFKVWFTIEVAAIAVVTAADILWVSATTGILIEILIRQTIAKSVGALGAGLIWLAYVWRSRRVANTFVY